MHAYIYIYNAWRCSVCGVVIPENNLFRYSEKILFVLTKINTGDIGYRGERRWVTYMSYRGE